MIKTVTNTTFTLGFIAVLNFILVTLVFRVLGKSGTTDMGLIVLGISFIVMISNIVGGSALVYLTSRESNFTLLIVSYLWAIFSMIFMGSILFTFELVPMEFIGWTILIGFLECIFSIHNQLFIGKVQMKNHNGLKLFQKITQVGLFILFSITFDNFVLSLLISYILVLLFSFYIVYNQLSTFKIEGFSRVFKKAISYGFQVQTSNILQLLNYRLLYFIIEKSMGSVLGLFIVAVQLSESLWIPSKALAIVQYGKVSTETEFAKKTKLSLSFLKASVLITFLLLLVLLLIPTPLFVYFFGEEILGIKPIILSLSLGVMAISFSQTFAHYFSGQGKYSVLVKGASIGLITLLISGWVLIYFLEIIGAGLATSLTYLVSCLYLGNQFFNHTSLKLKDLTIKKSDFTEFYSRLRKR